MNTNPFSTLHFTSTTASDQPRSDHAGERALVLGELPRPHERSVGERDVLCFLQGENRRLRDPRLCTGRERGAG